MPVIVEHSVHNTLLDRRQNGLRSDLGFHRSAHGLLNLRLSVRADRNGDISNRNGSLRYSTILVCHRGKVVLYRAVRRKPRRSMHKPINHRISFIIGLRNIITAFCKIRNTLIRNCQIFSGYNSLFDCPVRSARVILIRRSVLFLLQGYCVAGLGGVFILRLRPVLLRLRLDLRTVALRVSGNGRLVLYAFLFQRVDFSMRCRVYYPEFDSKQKQQGPQTVGTQGFAGL